MSSRVGDEAARAVVDPGAPEVGFGGADWRRAVRRFRASRKGTAGLGFLVFMVIACFGLVHLAPSPTAVPLSESTSGPSWAHWFGTDLVARDSLSRVLHGGQVSLKVAFGIAILSTLIGVVIGALAGFHGGIWDSLLMRFTDLWIALPAIPFLAVAVSIGTVDLGPLGTLDLGGPLGITLLLSLLLWGSIARVVRGATLSLREREFVDAARSLGAGTPRVLFTELLPNLVAPILVYATLLIPTNILFEAALSFLAVGVRPPTPTWGGMLAEATKWYQVAPNFMLFPGLAIFVTVLAFNLFGDGLRDALDPRSR